MNKPLVISSQSDLEALRHSQHVEQMLDTAIDQLMDLSKQNDKLASALQDAVQKNKPLRESRDWWMVACAVAVGVGLIEAVCIWILR